MNPISSFDVENRIGIMSFLRYKFSKFFVNSENTKSLIMTHDLKTIYDLTKEMDDIKKQHKTKQGSSVVSYNVYELKNNSTQIFSYIHRQEYTELLKMIYNYASGKEIECEAAIGNIMRQALEAFSTFEYKDGIDYVSRDPKVMELLKEPEYISYFSNLMYRLVLNGGSHREEEIKTMNDFNFFTLISETEKKRTARDVLCFIYILNKPHIVTHLKEIENIVEILNQWCQDIKKMSAII